MGSTYSLDTGMGEFHTGSRHPLSGTDHMSYFSLHVVPTGEGDYGYLAQYSQAFSGKVELASLGRLPTYERGTPIINPWVREAHQPWLATHLGEGNYGFKPMARGTCWHCSNTLGHGC